MPSCEAAFQMPRKAGFLQQHHTLSRGRSGKRGLAFIAADPILGVSPPCPKAYREPQPCLPMSLPCWEGASQARRRKWQSWPHGNHRAQTGRSAPQRVERRELSQAGEEWGNARRGRGRESPERGAGARRRHSPGKADTGGPELRSL